MDDTKEISDDLFQSLITEALELKLYESKRDLGQNFGVCASQVQRWIDGKSFPVMEARKIVYKIISDKKQNKKNIS